MWRLQQESVTRDDDESKTEVGPKHSLTKARYGKSIKTIASKTVGTI